jgi:hypothetical protein
MPLMDFPNSPSAGDTITYGYRTYMYTGTKWILANNSTILTAAFAQANQANLIVTGNTMSNSYFTVRAQRSKLNFVPGTNITINVDDDSAGDRANVTIAASAPALLRAPQVITTINSTQVWTKPTGLSYIIVEVQGGGGGGGGSTVATATGSGGGAGGYARRTIAAASLGATENMTVGSGGAGGTSGGAGTAGGSSTFGTTPFCTACGGAGGLTGGTNDAKLGGSGGLATSGDVNNQGGDGGASASPGTTTVSGTVAGAGQYAGGGGTSFFGGGGSAGKKSATGAAVVGQPGKAYGSGGGGGAGVSGTSASGGAGKQGIIIVWEFA